MQVIGLTGGIGTGKSSVANVLRTLGVPVVDADQVARDVMQPSSPTLAALVAAFSPEPILDEAGALDRAGMRSRIISDPAAKATLDRITHPAIRAAILGHVTRLKGLGNSHAVVEAALMVETGSYRLYAELIVVTCAPQTQLARVVARDATSEEAARGLIARQLPLIDKEAVATHLIRNDGTLEQLARATEAVWSVISS
jgi:dephospho-CoA kinase